MKKLYKHKRKYSLKQLRDLWVNWVDEKNINCQEFFEIYNLDGSFVLWLEKQENKEK